VRKRIANIASGIYCLNAEWWSESKEMSKSGKYKGNLDFGVNKYGK